MEDFALQRKLINSTFSVNKFTHLLSCQKENHLKDEHFTEKF